MPTIMLIYSVMILPLKLTIIRIEITTMIIIIIITTTTTTIIIIIIIIINK